MKFAHIVGARPQFIKYYPLSKEIAGYNQSAEERIGNILIHTGQHYDYSMSKVFFDVFGIQEPDYNLGVGSGTHGAQTGKIIKEVEEVLIKEEPDVVFVYGDTNSTLGGALAAVKLHIPVAHIEAGLRSFNRNMPEEINRIVTDHISTFLFCSSQTAVNNLKSEGFLNVLNNGELVPLGNQTSDVQAIIVAVNKNNPLVINVGDVMYDALLHSISILEQKENILDELGLEASNYCLLTLHRAENTENMEIFENILTFVNDAAADRKVIFPIHPRSKKIYHSISKSFDKIRIVEPAGYFDFLALLKNSALLMTDSGGMQKEAFWLGVPCITLRNETEWIETIESGWNVLYKDYNGEHSCSDNNRAYYGDGKASERILNYFLNTGE